MKWSVQYSRLPLLHELTLADFGFLFESGCVGYRPKLQPCSGHPAPHLSNDAGLRIGHRGDRRPPTIKIVWLFIKNNNILFGGCQTAKVMCCELQKRQDRLVVMLHLFAEHFLVEPTFHYDVNGSQSFFISVFFMSSYKSVRKSRGRSCSSLIPAGYPPRAHVSIRAHTPNNGILSAALGRHNEGNNTIQVQQGKCEKEQQRVTAHLDYC